MISTAVIKKIDELVSKMIDAAFDKTEGSSQTLWVSMAEEEGFEIRKEIAEEIVQKVLREGERSLFNNEREFKHLIAEALIAKVKNKVDEDFGAPLRALASSNE